MHGEGGPCDGKLSMTSCISNLLMDFSLRDIEMLLGATEGMKFPSSLHLCGRGSFRKHFFAAACSRQPRKQVGNLRNKSRSWSEENIDCLKKLPIANLISATAQISFTPVPFIGCSIQRLKSKASHLHQTPGGGGCVQ